MAQDNLGEPVLSQRRDLVQQPLDFYGFYFCDFMM